MKLRIHTEVGRILSTADTRKKADESGTSVALMTPQELGAFTQRELAHGGQVIRGAHIPLDGGT